MTTKELIDMLEANAYPKSVVTLTIRKDNKVQETVLVEVIDCSSNRTTIFGRVLPAPLVGN